ncbi:hypothetical protein ACFQ60_04935 [Streptomyces zhihengii]
MPQRARTTPSSSGMTAVNSGTRSSAYIDSRQAATAPDRRAVSSAKLSSSTTALWIRPSASCHTPSISPSSGRAATTAPTSRESAGHTASRARGARPARTAPRSASRRLCHRTAPSAYVSSRRPAHPEETDQSSAAQNKSSPGRWISPSSRSMT